MKSGMRRGPEKTANFDRQFVFSFSFSSNDVTFAANPEKMQFSFVSLLPPRPLGVPSL